MNIGELSRQSQISRDTIRFYEKLGLLPPATRHIQSDYKQYTKVHLDALKQVQILKAVGFTLTEISAFLPTSSSDNPCDGLPELIDAKLDAVERQITTLLAHKKSLISMRSQCSGNCKPSSRNGLPTCTPELSGNCC